MEHKDNGGLKTTETSLQIISCLKELEGGRVTEVAKAVNMAPSTVHNHLTTLEKNEYVIKEGDIYKLGLKFLNLGEYVRGRSDAYDFVKEKVEKLAEETGGRCHFVVEEHGYGVYLYTSSGEQAVKAYSSVGKRLPLHVAAAGKAILSNLEDWQVEEILDRRGLSRETTNTITDRERLFNELSEIQERGYAFNREEHLNGIKAVGAPVKGVDNRVIGAFSVSGPAHRMKGEWFEKELPNIVLGVSNELELNLQYS